MTEKLGTILGKPETVTLADGKEYKLYPLDLNDLADIEDKYGSLDVLSTSTKLSELRFMLYLMMRKDIKGLTLESVGQKISVHFLSSPKFAKVTEAIRRLNEAREPKNELQSKENQ